MSTYVYRDKDKEHKLVRFDVFLLKGQWCWSFYGSERVFELGISYRTTMEEMDAVNKVCLVQNGTLVGKIRK